MPTLPLSSIVNEALPSVANVIDVSLTPVINWLPFPIVILSVLFNWIPPARYEAPLPET